MMDDRDALLMQLFAEQDQPVHGSDFMAQFIDLMERDQRNRRIHRIGMIIVGVIVAALLAPFIAQVVATVIGSIAASATATRSLLDFPMAWLVVCSIVANFLPVIYLGTTRRW